MQAFMQNSYKKANNYSYPYIPTDPCYKTESTVNLTLLCPAICFPLGH